MRTKKLSLSKANILCGMWRGAFLLRPASLSLFNHAFRFPISQAAEPFGSLISLKGFTLLCLTEMRRTFVTDRGRTRVVSAQGKFVDGVEPY